MFSITTTTSHRMNWVFNCDARRSPLQCCSLRSHHFQSTQTLFLYFHPCIHAVYSFCQKHNFVRSVLTDHNFLQEIFRVLTEWERWMRFTTIQIRKLTKDREPGVWRVRLHYYQYARTVVRRACHETLRLRDTSLSCLEFCQVRHRHCVARAPYHISTVVRSPPSESAFREPATQQHTKLGVNSSEQPVKL